MENKSDKNNVHFYVARDKKGALWLYLKKPVRSSQMFLSSHWGKIITKENYFSKYGLNKNDFDNLKWELEDLPNEEWKVIEGFWDRYSVSNYGRVKTNSITYALNVVR